MATAIAAAYDWAMEFGKHTALISALAIVLGLALAACGDDGGGATDAATDSAAGDSGARDSGTTPDGATRDSGRDDAGTSDGGGGSDAAIGDAGPDGANCDRSTITCRQVEPECPEGTVPEVEGTCWTERCIRIDGCACTGPEQCPMPEIYTCHSSAGRCGPYL